MKTRACALVPVALLIVLATPAILLSSGEAQEPGTIAEIGRHSEGRPVTKQSSRARAREISNLQSALKYGVPTLLSAESPEDVATAMKMVKDLTGFAPGQPYGQLTEAQSAEFGNILASLATRMNVAFQLRAASDPRGQQMLNEAKQDFDGLSAASPGRPGLTVGEARGLINPNETLAYIKRYWGVPELEGANLAALYRYADTRPTANERRGLLSLFHQGFFAPKPIDLGSASP
jgi:hypothetical protein